MTADEHGGAGSVAVSTSSQSIAERAQRLVSHSEVIGEPWFVAGNTRAAHAVELDAYMASWIVDELAALQESGVV